MTDHRSVPTLTTAMKIVIAVVAVLVVVGGIVVSALLSAGGTPDAATTATTPGSTGASAQAAAPGASGAASSHPSRGPLPEATPTSGSEVLPPTATPHAGLPKITPAPPLVAGPLPRSASEQGALVKGFPARVMGPLKGARVASSSIATQGSAMQVSLVAISAASHDAITKHYEQQWSALGLKRGQASDGTLVYAGAHESVTLSFGSSGTGNRYTVYGVFRTK
ncbi:hypothetical protein [Microbacterium sp.]|uniref:hypothetical protein n=1 Tax=Microbacterium sp. TaxID=51671 RepID=UPI003A949F7D